MALTKAKKQAIVSDVAELFSSSKMTVVAKYQGTSVKALQTLRREAKANGTTVKVVKNRLVMQALKATDSLKDTDTSPLEGMLLYAFNADDEVAAAQSLNNFAKATPTLEFVGAIDSEGLLLSAEQVRSLASLPGKNQLLAGLINTLNSPLNNAISSLGGNLAGLIQGLSAKATN